MNTYKSGEAKVKQHKSTKSIVLIYPEKVSVKYKQHNSASESSTSYKCLDTQCSIFRFGRAVAGRDIETTLRNGWVSGNAQLLSYPLPGPKWPPSRVSQP